MYGLTLFCIFRYFKFEATPVSQASALTSCLMQGGTLAEPRTQLQFDAIRGFSSFSNQFWVGGRDPLENGNWAFFSNDDPVPLGQFFRASEPNNSGFNEFCLEFLIDGLNDQTCANQRPYLCEFGARGNAQVC